MANYVSRGQQALLKVQRALALNPLEGRSVQAIADATEGVSRDQVFRALKNLEHAGNAEQGPAGWRPTPQAAFLAERVRLALADLHNLYLGAGRE